MGRFDRMAARGLCTDPGMPVTNATADNPSAGRGQYTYGEHAQMSFNELDRALGNPQSPDDFWGPARSGTSRKRNMSSSYDKFESNYGFKLSRNWTDDFDWTGVGTARGRASPPLQGKRLQYEPWNFPREASTQRCRDPGFGPRRDPNRAYNAGKPYFHRYADGSSGLQQKDEDMRDSDEDEPERGRIRYTEKDGLLAGESFFDRTVWERGPNEPKKYVMDIGGQYLPSGE